METLHLFRESESGEVYSARDLAHAKALWLEDTGQDPDDGTVWQSVPDEKSIKVVDTDDGTDETKTALQWANDEREAFGERHGGPVFVRNY